MIAASEGANNEHLATLSKLSTFLMDTAFRDQLLAAQSIDDVIAIIDRKEAEESDEEEEEVQSTSADDTFIIGVTGCPTGIAHTYMAADALKKRSTRARLLYKGRNKWFRRGEKSSYKRRY